MICQLFISICHKRVRNHPNDEIDLEETDLVQKRLVWIDIAKGITILCMIVGHVYPLEHPVRNLIFSFHMPMFFILSGYTAKHSVNWSELWNRTCRDAKRLYIPCLITVVLYMGQRYLATLLGMNDESLSFLLGSLPGRLFWSSGVDQPYYHMGAGWFLVTLFWVRFLYESVQLVFPGQYNGVIYLFMMLGGYGLSRNFWLPQSLDIALIAVGFYWCGVLFRKNDELLRGKWIPMIGAAFFFWMICVENGFYLEMATRSYPGFVLSLVAALAGSACVMLLARALESSSIAKYLASIGRHTLLLLCVHQLDGYLAWGGVTFSPSFP